MDHSDLREHALRIHEAGLGDEFVELIRKTKPRSRSWKTIYPDIRRFHSECDLIDGKRDVADEPALYSRRVQDDLTAIKNRSYKYIYGYLKWLWRENESDARYLYKKAGIRLQPIDQVSEEEQANSSARSGVVAVNSNAGSRPIWPPKGAARDWFTFGLSYGGPVLETPNSSETWSDAITSKLRKNMSTMGIGPKRKDYEKPRDIAWSGADKVGVMGGGRNVYIVDLNAGYTLRKYVAPALSDWRPLRLSSQRSPFDASCKLWLMTNWLTFGEIWERKVRGHPERAEVFANHGWVYLTHHGWLPMFLEGGLVIAKRPMNWTRNLPMFSRRIDPYFLCRVLSDGDVVCEWRYPRDKSPIGEVEFSASGRFVSFCNKRFDFQIIDTEADKIAPTSLVSDLRKKMRFGLALLCWHPMEDWFATTYNRSGGNRFAIVEASSGAILCDEPLDRTSNSTAIAWSPDGRYLAIGGEDQSIILWDCSIGSARRLLGHTTEIEKIIFSPDSQRLLSIGEPFGYTEKNVRVWATELHSKPLFSTTLEMVHVRGSPWSPDGRKFIGNGKDQSLQVFELKEI